MATSTKSRKWPYILGMVFLFIALGRLTRHNSTETEASSAEKNVSKAPTAKPLSEAQQALKAKYSSLIKDCCWVTTEYRRRRRATTIETDFSINKYERLMQKNGFTRKPNGHLTEYQKIVNKDTVVVEHLTQPAKGGWFHIDSVHIH